MPKLAPLSLSESEMQALIPIDRLRRQIGFIVEVEKLKRVLRKTPLLDASRQENDAEHSWELALMAIVLAEHADENLDTLRALKMILIHDIVEIDAGDTFIYDEAALMDQEARERIAADRIFGLLPDEQATDFRNLWDEFEARQSAEARFARAMDRLQPLLHNFFTSGGTWHTAGVTSADVLARKRPISDSSDVLWQAAQDIIAEGVKKGFLSPGTPERAE